LTGDDLSSLYNLLVPTRYRIYRTIVDSGKPMYAGKIAEQLGLDRKLVSFHLSELEEQDFLKSEFKVMNPEKGAPKAAKYYHPTGNAEKLLQRFKQTLPETKPSESAATH